MRIPSRSSQVVAIIFVTVMAVGMVGAIVGLVRWDPEDPQTWDIGAREKLAAIINGSISERAESLLDSGMPLRTAAVRFSASIRYLLFRAGDDGVVIGRDGWLYTREEFEHHPGDKEILDRRLAFVASVRDQLAGSRIGLLIALLPSKARVVDDHLSARWARLADHQRYEAALGELSALGIPAPDLRAALGSVSDPFLRTDTHWTTEGAKAVAGRLAAVASDLGYGSGGTEYETIAIEQMDVIGDLISFLPIGGLANLLGISPESAARYESILIQAPSLGLFDTPTIPVTLVGTSYSADSRWNFIGALQEALRSDVLNISTEAVGPFVPMADYLHGSALAEVQPEYVIWEIPERYLTLPDIEVPEL